MSTFHTIGEFVWASDNKKNQKEGEQEQKEQYLELMYMHQQYNGIISKQKYALRGSKLSCSYGTDYSLLDIIQDHGIYKDNFSVMTTIDSGKTNIHHFGSCLCPESNYSGRLPMTVGTRENGKRAKKAACNNYAHICVPMIPEGSAWKQVGHSIMAKTAAAGYVPLLLDNAVLVCQYGGLIRIVEVPKTGTGQISYDDALAKALRLTAAFEGGGVTGNFDGQGLSMGMFQFNFGQQSLQPLLLDMISQHPNLMKSFFGSNYNTLDSILKGSYSNQMIWVKSINDSSNDIIEPWKTAFTALNNSTEFNSVLLNSATFKIYVTQTKSIVNTYNLETERGIVLAFDIAIQNWSTDGDNAFISKVLAMTNESDKLKEITNRLINKSSSQYQADVSSRKNTIVNGIGIVHEINYTLSDPQYDILDRLWY